jgi:hypothetical protein
MDKSTSGHRVVRPDHPVAAEVAAVLIAIGDPEVDVIVVRRVARQDDDVGVTRLPPTLEACTRRVELR